MINIIGKTTDDKMVVNGVFRFFETEGIPFDIIFDLLKRNNAIPDWISLYKEAVLSGMKHSRVISMLEGFISDAFGVEISNVVIGKLEELYGSRK
jgi:hypothetical protein